MERKKISNKQLILPAFDDEVINKAELILPFVLLGQQRGKTYVEKICLCVIF